MPGYLPYISLGVRLNRSNEMNITSGDDVVSPEQVIPIDFPFGTSVQSTLYVSKNFFLSLQCYSLCVLLGWK